ncbi:hypothetical protein Bpfe_001425 [Biomphalaria pfeifferi]|uniref:Uncharacterized protein n=1 Tax=Biomphalaria pfeifferi TaxID=112525 RepID=A0AAD8FMD6_BIOPF|nr:hypothetical protein Bpfe_001425 [Biomphalaria pfeifferi]
MSDNNSNSHRGCCHSTSGSSRLLNVSNKHLLVCSVGNQIDQQQNPYVLTYEQNYRLFPLNTNDINCARHGVKCQYTEHELRKATQMTVPNANVTSACTELFRSDLYNIKNRHFDGSKVIRRMTFKCEQRIYQNGQQQPTPSDISSRYRPVHPLFFRNISSQMWRNPDRKPQLPQLTCRGSYH